MGEVSPHCDTALYGLVIPKPAAEESAFRFDSKSGIQEHEISRQSRGRVLADGAVIVFQ
jgi:hypothetical protein